MLTVDSQLDSLATALEQWHISPQKIKKSVHWAPDAVDNDGKSCLLKEIRGLRRVKRTLWRAFADLEKSFEETKAGLVPEEYQNTNFITSSDIREDIIRRAVDNLEKQRGCNDHIYMRHLSLEWLKSPSWRQTYGCKGKL